MRKPVTNSKGLNHDQFSIELTLLVLEKGSMEIENSVRHFEVRQNDIIYCAQDYGCNFALPIINNFEGYYNSKFHNFTVPAV